MNVNKFLEINNYPLPGYIHLYLWLHLQRTKSDSNGENLLFITLKEQIKIERNVYLLQRWKSVKQKQLKTRKKSTRRAQIPRKPLEPPISWIVTQSLIFQIADPSCVFASTQNYKRPFLWSSCVIVEQCCRRETPEMKILGWIPCDHEILWLSRGSEQ